MKLNPRIRRLFDELADLPLEARAQYWAAHPADEAVRHEVEDLLAFDPGPEASPLYAFAALIGRILFRSR